MKPENFCYWLQGYFEIMNARDDVQNNGEVPAIQLGPREVQAIRNHLNMVFIHSIDPGLGDQAMQGKLQAAHSGTTLKTLQDIYGSEAVVAKAKC